MHLVINTLNSVSSRYAPSRFLSFNSAHVFKTLQLMDREGYVSRLLLIKELRLGEGSIKTLVKHLKMEKLIITTSKGTTMSERGRKIFEQMSQFICGETQIPMSSISVSKFNYAVLLRYVKFAIKQGVEQRDAAIKIGAKGATTLVYKDGKFLIPGSRYNALKDEKKIDKLLKDKLKPVNDDIIIIGSDDSNIVLSELASKAAALYTLESHGNHKHLELVINLGIVIPKKVSK